MNPKLRLIIALAVIAIAFGGWWLFKQNGDSGKMTLYGNVDIRQIDLAFAVDGPLKEVMVDEGDSVKQGQILARLDVEPYQFALAQAEATAAQATANQSKAEAGSRSQEIDSARAAVAEARARLANAEAVLRRRQSLVKEDAVSRQTLEDAARDVDVARAMLNARNAALTLSIEGLRSEDIDAARAVAKAAEAGASLAKYKLEHTALVAPGDGTILTRIREPGSIVATGAPVLTLSLVNPVWVRSYVDEPHLGRVAPGTKVIVATDDPSGKTYRGTVGFVSPTAEFTPKAVETPELRTDLVYRLRIVVDAPDRQLRQGMPVTVTLDSAP